MPLPGPCQLPSLAPPQYRLGDTCGTASGVPRLAKNRAGERRSAANRRLLDLEIDLVALSAASVIAQRQVSRRRGSAARRRFPGCRSPAAGRSGRLHVAPPLVKLPSRRRLSLPLCLTAGRPRACPSPGTRCRCRTSSRSFPRRSLRAGRSSVDGIPRRTHRVERCEDVFMVVPLLSGSCSDGLRSGGCSPALRSFAAEQGGIRSCLGHAIVRDR